MSDTEDINIADTIISNVTPSCLIYEFVRYQLQGPNDYTNVSYIREECGRTHCGLCQTVLLDRPWTGCDETQQDVLEKHVHTLRHETRFLQLKHLQKRHVRFIRNKRLQKSGKLRKRLCRLGLTKWRWHVNHLVMEYIDSPLPEKPTTFPMPEERRWRIAACQLATYEQMERVSLLELAIRRVTSRNAGNGVGKIKREHDEEELPSIKNGTSIIIPLVMEFLGKPIPLPLV